MNPKLLKIVFMSLAMVLLAAGEPDLIKEISTLIAQRSPNIFGDRTPVHGIRVMDIKNDGNGARAGMLNGDIIVKFNEKNVPSMDIFNTWRKKAPGSLEIYRNGEAVNINVAPGLIGINMMDYDNIKSLYKPDLSDIETAVSYVFTRIAPGNPLRANNLINNLPNEFKIRDELKGDLSVLSALLMGRDSEIAESKIDDLVKKAPALYASAYMNSLYSWGKYAKCKRLYNEYGTYDIRNLGLDIKRFTKNGGISDLISSNIDLYKSKIQIEISKREDRGNMTDEDIMNLANGSELSLSVPTSMFAETIIGPELTPPFIMTFEYSGKKTDNSDSEFDDALSIGFYQSPANGQGNMSKMALCHNANNYIIVRINGKSEAAFGSELPLDGKSNIKLQFVIEDKKWSIFTNGKEAGRGYTDFFTGEKLSPFVQVVGMTVKLKAFSIMKP